MADSGSVPPEGAPTKRSYTHSDYVCERCRKAHRRCRHDPADDPTFDPTRIRKRRRRKAGDSKEPAMSPAASTSRTSESRDTLGLASLPRLLTDPPLLTVDVRQSASPAELITNETLAAAMLPIFLRTKVMQDYWQRHGVMMLETSSALRAAAIGHYLSTKDGVLDRTEARRYIQTAIRLSSSVGGARGLCTDYLLGFNTFHTQGAFTAFASHAARARVRIPAGDDVRLSCLYIDPYVVSIDTMKAHADLVQPFIEFWPTIGFNLQDWKPGGAQDLLTLMLDAINLLQQPDKVLDVMHHLWFFLATRMLPSQTEAVSNLICETVFVLCMQVLYPVPNACMEALAAHTHYHEAGFQSLLFPRLVLQRASQGAASTTSSKATSLSSMREMNALIFSDDRFKDFTALFCSDALSEGWLRDVVWKIIPDDPTLLHAACSVFLLHFCWHERRDEGLEHARLSRLQSPTEPQRFLIWEYLQMLIAIAQVEPVELYRQHVKRQGDAFVAVLSDLDNQPEAFRKSLLSPQPARYCAQDDLNHFRIFYDNFSTLFPTTDFHSDKDIYGIVGVLALVIEAFKCYFGMVGVYRQRAALHLFCFLRSAISADVTPTQPQGLFRLISLEATYLMLLVMAYPDRLDNDARVSLATKLADAEALCQVTLHQVRLVLAILDGTIYEPARFLYHELK